MNKILASAAILALAGCTYGAPPGPPPPGLSPTNIALTEELRGYVLDGPPRSCVYSRDLQGNRSAGPGAIIFRGRGNRLYVNYPRTPCPELRFARALRTRTISSQLCRGEIVSVFDPTTGVDYGSCGLGDFVPYRRLR